MKRLFLIVSVSMILLDQATKVWARSAADWTEGKTFLALWPNIFELKLVYNRGIAFGMFQGSGVWLTPIALAIAVGALWYSVKHRDEPRWTHVTMSLLFAGAVGNLIDRIAFNQVTDLFDFRLINFPVFNVADVCISIAGVMLAWSALGDIFVKKEPSRVEIEPQDEAPV